MIQFLTFVVLAASTAAIVIFLFAKGYRKWSLVPVGLVAAAFLVAFLFVGGGEVDLSHLARDEQPQPYQVGDFLIQVDILDEDAPEGRETVFFGDEYAVEIPRLYDDENGGLRIEVSRGGRPYDGVVEIRHPALRSAPAVSLVPRSDPFSIGQPANMMLAEETVQLEVRNGVAEWQGQPLVGNALTGDTNNQLTVVLPAGEAIATLHAFSRYGAGAIRDNVIETRTEMAQVLSSDQPSDQMVQAAVREICGMEPSDITAVDIRTNDQERFQAGLAPGGEHAFVAADVVIPVGQPIWVATDGDKGECPLNPPCGNPPPPPPPTPTPTPTPPPTVTPTPTPTPPLEGEIKVIKFHDKDRDCVQDSDEPFLSGFSFKVTGPISFTFTIGEGPERRTVPPGKYTVEEIGVPEHWAASPCMRDPQTGKVIREVTVEAGRPPAKAFFGNILVKVQPTPSPTPTPTPPAPTPTPTPREAPTPTPTPTPVPPKCLVTILGPHRLDNTDTHARMQASVQWDLPPNFSPTIKWYLDIEGDPDDDFIGAGEQVEFMATLNANHTLTVKVFEGSQVICSDLATFAEGSIPPGEEPPGTDPLPTETPIPAPSPTPDPDDSYQGPE